MGTYSLFLLNPVSTSLLGSSAPCCELVCGGRIGSWCCVHFHGAHVALEAPVMSRGAQRFSGAHHGADRVGCGTRWTHGALGSMGTPGIPHCVSCGAWRGGEEQWDGSQSLGCLGCGAGSSHPHGVLSSPPALSPSCTRARNRKCSSGVTKVQSTEGMKLGSKHGEGS